MVTSNKPKYPFPKKQPDDPSFEILRKWREQLEDRKEQRAVLPGQRAALRRAGTLTEVMFCPAFHYLLRDLRNAGYSIFKDEYQQKLAAIAGLAAHIEDKPGTLGTQFGTPNSSDKPALSELRARRILACDDPEELYTQFRRALGILDDTASLADLAYIVWYWMPLADKRTKDSRRQLACDYYAAAPLKKS